METAKRKSGDRFREEIVINGKRIRGPWFNKKTEARKWKVLMKASALQGKIPPDILIKQNGKSPFFNDYSKYWLHEVKAYNLTQGSIDNYRSNLRVHLNPFFKIKRLSQITSSDITRLITHLKKGHNAKGINLIIAVAKAIFNQALKEELISKTPFQDIPNLIEDTKADVFWSKQEIDQFLTKNRFDENYELYVTALFTGLRKGELCGLKWDRVDFNQNLLTVSRTKNKKGLRDTTKGKKIRFVPISDNVKYVLKTLLQRNNNSEFVFLKKNSSPVGYGHLYRDFGDAQKKAGMIRHIRFHDMRHTFASQFMMNGGSIFDLQKILGHTKIDMTMKYAHFSEQYLQGATNHMNFFNITPKVTPDDSNAIQFSM